MPQHRFQDHPFAHEIAARIGELVRDCCGDRPGCGLLVGLSGGPDSVALLLAARVWADETASPLAAAHFHHELRPVAADGDAQFCRELCAAMDVPLHESREDARPVARLRGRGLEEAARHLRRRFFRRLLAAEPALRCVATGHHRDDQTETVLMRLFRGTGPGGLRGILPVSGAVIHPLLAVGRGEILAFLEDCGQPWRTDATNLEGDNLRARIRREFLPLARGIFGPGSETAPARLAQLLGQDMALLEDLTKRALAATRLPAHPEQLSVTRLLDMAPGMAARVLKLWLEQMQPSDLERVHVDDALAWLADGQSGSGLDLPGGIRLVRDFDRLSRREVDSAAPVLRKAADYRILVARSSQPPSAELPGCGDPADEATWHLTCPVACLVGNLQVRNWRPGDRFQPFGLEGSKKLSDLLREKRIPRETRSEVLVVADEAGILWVVGLARAERTRLLPSTERTVTITVAQRTEDPHGLS